MRPIQDPELNFIATRAATLPLQPLHPAAHSPHSSLKMPRLVGYLPNSRLLYVVKMYLGQTQRILARCRDVDSAARISDVVAVTFNPYRRSPLDFSQRYNLNYSVKDAEDELAQNSLLAEWVAELLDYCQKQGWLRTTIEPEAKPQVEPGQDRRKYVRARFALLESELKSLRDRQENLEKKFNELNVRGWCGLIIPEGVYPQTTTTIGGQQPLPPARIDDLPPQTT